MRAAQRAVFLVLSLAALVALAAGCRQAPALRFGGDSYVGVHYDCLHDDPARRARVLDLLATAHAGWVRFNVEWNALQPTSRSLWNRTELHALDDCVGEASRRGLRPDLVFYGTPAWAGGGTWSSPPTYPADYANAAARLAHRYEGQVRAWEIWNEENTPKFWTGTPADYASLLRASYLPLKRADPAARVVFGGIFGSDPAWIESAYVAGARGSFDVLATHPYPGETTVAAQAESAHDVMLANEDGTIPIWFTESGWAAPLRVSLMQQAARLTGMYESSRTELPYVKAVFWFQAVSAPTGATPWEHDLELLNDDLAPRPAYEALANVPQ